MQKDVLIEVSGLQMIDEEGRESPIEMVVPGEHYFRNGSHYLKYEEILDESAVPTTNYVKMSADAMEVRKKGLINVHMVFEMGKKSVALYTTPFGTIQMGIAPTLLDFRETEDQLAIQVDYALEMNEYHVANCSIAIKVKPQGLEGFELIS